MTTAPRTMSEYAPNEVIAAPVANESSMPADAIDGAASNEGGGASAVAAPAAAVGIEPAAPPAHVPTMSKADAARAAIAARFQTQRAAERPETAGHHVPPFIEQQTAQEVAAPALEAPAAAAQPVAVENAQAAPIAFLNINGQKMAVQDRDQLIRLAEVDPSEVQDFTDAQLTRLAQRRAATTVPYDPARGAASVSQPAQQPAPPAPLPDLEASRLAYVEKLQFGDAQEAAQALGAYEKDQRAHAEAQARERDWRRGVTDEVAAFGERNQDIANNPAASDLLLMSATREMGQDLLRLGLTHEQLGSAMSNPKEMTEAFNYARQAGMAVRTNGAILEAAGAKVRDAFGMQPPQAPAILQPAVPSRVEAKRGLQQQPTSSAAPVEIPQQPRNEVQNRSAVIQAMKARTKGSIMAPG